MPKIGLTIDEAEVVEWLVPVGADVVVGQPLVVLNADKAEVELEAPATGRLSQIVVGPGGVVVVAGVLGTIAVFGEVVVPATTITSKPQGPQIASPPADPQPSGQPRSSTPRHRASPRARFVARELSVEIRSAVGTGPGGRVIERDIRHAVLAVAGQRQPTRATFGETRVVAHLRIAATLAHQRRLRAAGDPVRFADLVLSSLAQALPDSAEGTIAIAEGGNSRFELLSLREALLGPAVIARRRRETTRTDLPSMTTAIVVDGSETSITQLDPQHWPGCALSVGIGSIEQRPIVVCGQFVVAEMTTISFVADAAVWSTASLIALAERVVDVLEFSDRE